MVALCVTFVLRLFSTKRCFIRIQAAYVLNQRHKKLRTMTVAGATTLKRQRIFSCYISILIPLWTQNNISQAESVTFLKQKGTGKTPTERGTTSKSAPTVFHQRKGTNYLRDTLCCSLYFKHGKMDTIQRASKSKCNIPPSES